MQSTLATSAALSDEMLNDYTSTCANIDAMAANETSDTSDDTEEVPSAAFWV
ncbi:hypothetical protein [Dictyobacter arantiisoli]|uniref:Uncharacterized protein n=1 Tax=Dictyobacter arantiisoli TaxID=2014874 RepID=A0A5A5TEW6_9CHLR|nr:hypothetical protein [Dictyobacter arantiisoli]GCF09559.1 hypothetical protein KDI_31230 [Dictyobacter arantiisoli]